MSGPTAPNWYKQQFQDQATHAYQAGGFALRNTTLPPVKVTGNKLYFPIAGPIEAEDDVRPGDTAAVANANDTMVEVTTTKSRAYTEVHEDDLDQMGVAQMQVEAQRAAKALGRRHDRTIIRALKATPQTIGANTEKMSLDHLLKAGQMLQANDVDWDGEVFCAVDSVAWNNLLGYKHFNSADYVGPDLPFVKGKLARSWNGIHVFQLSDKILEVSGANGVALLWHRSSIGFGYVRDVTTTVQWDNKKDCWGHNSRMRIGSKLLLPQGAVRITHKYAPAEIAITS